VQLRCLVAATGAAICEVTEPALSAAA